MYVESVRLPEAGLRAALTWLALQMAHVGAAPEGEGLDDDGLPIALGWAENMASQWMASPDPARRKRQARLSRSIEDESASSIEHSAMTNIVLAMFTGEIPQPQALREISTFFGFDSLPEEVRPDSATDLLEASFAEAHGARLLEVTRECPVVDLLAARDAAVKLAETLPQIAELMKSDFGSPAMFDDLLASPIRLDDRAVAAQALLIASHRWSGPGTATAPSGASG